MFRIKVFFITQPNQKAIKMTNIINKIYHLFKSEEQGIVLSAPESTTARFELVFKNISIGTLTLDNGMWTFLYTDEFKKQAKINVITDFPDKEKTYESNTLFPFFAFRIPSLQRLKIQNLVSLEDIPDEVQLLKKFGKQSIVNPYQLMPSL